MEASEPNIGCQYQPQQIILPFGFFRELPKLFQSRWLGGLRLPRSQKWADQRVASHYSTLWNQAKWYWVSLPATTESLAFLAPFTNLPYRCSGGVRSPRSQPWVDQGSDPTIQHFGKKPTDNWASLTATIEELFFVLLFSWTLALVARLLRGAWDHSYEWIKDGILPMYTMEANGPKIGRHYHPE
jgi:hypothetical protein